MTDMLTLCCHVSTPFLHHRYKNGTVAAFNRVERPLLLFDPSGAPTLLINGVQRYDDDYTFTLVRRIGA